MPLPENHDALSFGDALFLHLERDGMPLNMAAVALLEGAVSFDQFTACVESKLPAIPRYLQRVVTPPFFSGLPVWEYDRSFDIRNHVHEVALRHGTDRELKSSVAAIISTVMDRGRPLWDLTLFRGLRGNRTALLARVHHCLADGISGVGLLKVMLDPAPTRFVPPARKHPLRIPPGRDPATILLDALVNTCLGSVERLLTLESQLLEYGHRLASPGNAFAHPPAQNGAEPEESNGAPDFAAIDRLRPLLPELAAPATRLPFNLVCRGPQRFDWTEIPLDELKKVKRACDATVNDVVLSLVTAAIQRYARLHEVRLRRRLLKIVVPVSVRGRSHSAELGNRISFVPVSIPLDIHNLRRLVAATRDRTAVLKSSHLAELVGFAGTALGMIPPALQALFGPILSQLPLSVCNLICTNVPGPKTPLYLLGHKVLSCLPVVPIGGEMGLNCAVLTYNGVACFGFTGDVHAVPDLELLPRFLNRSFQELRTAVLKPAARRRPPRPARPGAPTFRKPATGAEPSTPAAVVA